MKKVLMALNYDPSSHKIAEAGYSFAKTMKAELTLLHVLADAQEYDLNEHVTVTGFAGQADTDEAVKEETVDTKKLSLQFLEKSKLHLADNQIKTRLEEGDCAEVILNVASKIKVDAIVMGAHSRKWVENKTMGRVTEKVLQNTTIPVLIIPTTKQINPDSEANNGVY